MRLLIHNLNAFYGDAQILFDLGLSVGEGEVVALLGRNGAGKSTTLKSVVGLIETYNGQIVFDGEDILRLPTHQIIQRGLGFVPEDRRIFAGLSVAENLMVGRQPARPDSPAWDERRVYRLFPSLAELASRRAGQISGGEQQMLTIARSLMGNPSTILLDEPSEGLAPKIVDDLSAAIATMKNEGLSVLLSEQNLQLAHAITDRAVIIEQGRVRFDGTMDELVGDPSISHAYLAV